MFALRPWHLLTRARYKHWLFTKTLGCCTVMLAELGRFSVGIIDGEPYWGGASFTLGYIFDFSIFLHWTRLDSTGLFNCCFVSVLPFGTSSPFAARRGTGIAHAIQRLSISPNGCACVCVCRRVRACVFLSIEIRSCCYTVATHEEHVCLSMYCSCLRVCVCVGERIGLSVCMFFELCSPCYPEKNQQFDVVYIWSQLHWWLNSVET